MKIIIVFVLIIISLSGCQKNNSSEELKVDDSNIRIKKIFDPNNNSYQEFSYNSEGLLEKFVSYSASEKNMTTASIKYNSEKLPVQIIGGYGNAEIVWGEGNQKFSIKVTHSTGYVLYDAILDFKKQIKTLECKFFDKGGNLINTPSNYLYSYSWQNNSLQVLRKEDYFNEQYSIIFDNYNNPFKHINVALVLMLDLNTDFDIENNNPSFRQNLFNPVSLSYKMIEIVESNGVLREDNLELKYDYSYTYNADNYPQKVTVTVNSKKVEREAIFQYE